MQLSHTTVCLNSCVALFYQSCFVYTCSFRVIFYCCLVSCSFPLLIQSRIVPKLLISFLQSRNSTFLQVTYHSFEVIWDLLGDNNSCIQKKQHFGNITQPTPYAARGRHIAKTKCFVTFEIIILHYFFPIVLRNMFLPSYLLQTSFKKSFKTFFFMPLSPVKLLATSYSTL